MSLNREYQAKILVVEDCLVNMELTKEMLEMVNCEVDIAENGEEAIEMYDDSSYDLIFMDIQMPKKDGVTVTKEIRQKETKSGRHTPIIALTASVMDEDRKNYFAAGMDDIIAKPLKSAELVRVLDYFLLKKAES